MFRLLSPIICRPIAARTFHHSAISESQRALTFSRLRHDLGPDYAKRTVPVHDLLQGLKSLQSERLLTNNNEKSAFYRDGYRDICQIADGREDLSIGEIQEVLTDDNAVTWRAISKLLTTGTIPELEALDEGKKATVLFGRVHGIGPARAKELAGLGYRTIDELKNSSSTLIKKATKLALANLEQMEKPIPRSEMEVYHQVIGDALAQADPDIQFELLGSFRRGQAFSLSVELAIWHPSYSVLRDNDEAAKSLMSKVKAALTAARLMSPDFLFSNGIKKTMVLTRLPEKVLPGAGYRLMDVRLCNTTSVPYFLLHNTGDETLMKILRREAFHRGLVSTSMGWESETSRKRTALGVPYLQPTDRSYKIYEKLMPRHLLSA